MLVDDIKKQYLINERDIPVEDDPKLRLKSVREDDTAYKDLFRPNKDIQNEKSNITQSYKFFIGKLASESKEKEKVVKKIWNSIDRLRIVEVKLTLGEDDPQVIFETLNSTGLDLSESDLIRNYILMGEKGDVQKTFYEKYWYEVEKNLPDLIRGKKIKIIQQDEFFRHYLALKTGSLPKEDKIHRTFKTFYKKYCDDEDKKSERSDSERLKSEGLEVKKEFLEELLRFSGYYKQIRGAEVEVTGDQKEKSIKSSMAQVNLVLKNINLLGTTVFPLLLDVFEKWKEKNELDTSQVLEILQFLESFMMRRAICGLTTNGYNTIFSSFPRNTMADENPSNYYEGRIIIFLEMSICSLHS